MEISNIEMEDNISDVPAASSFSSRHRSPTFGKKEVMSLLNLVEKHRVILFNKSTTASVNHAKDRVWLKITKTFNNMGFEHKRTPDSLKTKFENLKRDAKRMSRNLLENDHCDETTKFIASLLYNSENSTNSTEDLDLDAEVNEEKIQEQSAVDSIVWNDNAEKYSDDSLDEADHRNKRTINRSINFSPDECRLLLQCVRQEKKTVFSEGKTSDAYKVRDQAWSRIACTFNKQSPRKRSAKVLRTKFCNMKKFAKNIKFKDIIRPDKKHHKLIEENDSKVKSEPMVDDEQDNSSNDECDNNQHPGMDPTTHDIAADPLSTVLNGSCRIDTMIPSDNKDIVRLKLELLNYELETAKLQRRRVELLMEAEAAERASRAAETGLRLRAARLAAEAEAARLPPTHPALPLAPYEATAQHYLSQYQT